MKDKDNARLCTSRVSNHELLQQSLILAKRGQDFDFGQSNFLCFRQVSIVAKTPIQTMIRAMVMAHPKSCRPLLSKMLPMISVAVTWNNKKIKK